MRRSNALRECGRIHVLPTEICSKVRVLGERDRECEGEGGKAMQKKRNTGSGADGGGRW